MGYLNYKILSYNQHIHDMCHVQSLEKDFYLGALGSFDHDSTFLALGVAILNFHNHIEVFFERFLIVCHLVLKENHPRSFHNIM